MTKQFKFLALCFTALAVVLVSSCSNEDDFFSQQPDKADAHTRATENPDGSYTITFDDFDPYFLAGPTSQGGNYYSYLTQDPIQYILDPEGLFVSEVNTVSGYQDLSSGGIALSNWNYRSNTSPNDPVDWWYSWENQMSVYNTASVDRAHAGAGHNGTDNFGVVYGYLDSYNEYWMAKPQFMLYAPSTLVGLWICNTSYTYGVIQNGNTFGNIGAAPSLKEMKGYFEVVLECYDLYENPLGSKTFILADYREGYPQVDPVTEWTYWEINIDNVELVTFNFRGSDVDPLYGLNTPAYLCIDDITIR